MGSTAARELCQGYSCGGGYLDGEAVHVVVRTRTLRTYSVGRLAVRTGREVHCLRAHSPPSRRRVTGVATWRGRPVHHESDPARTPVGWEDAR